MQGLWTGYVWYENVVWCCVNVVLYCPQGNCMMDDNSGDDNIAMVWWQPNCNIIVVFGWRERERENPAELLGHDRPTELLRDNIRRVLFINCNVIKLWWRYYCIDSVIRIMWMNIKKEMRSNCIIPSPLFIYFKRRKQNG